MAAVSEEDDIPLLPVTSQTYKLEALRKVQQSREIEAGRTDADAILAERGFDDEINGEFLLHASPKQRRKTRLVIEDGCLLILDYLQIYALIMAMAVRWPWPTDWLYSTRFLLFFNLDIWEFLKINTAGVLSSARDGFIDSSLIGIDYRILLLVWTVLCFVGIVTYICFYIGMNYQKKYNLLLQVAKLKRVFVMLAQIFAIPMGITFAKVFHCNSEGQMDVHNETVCGSVEYIVYACIGVFIILGIFVVLPIWMIIKIRAQIFSYKSDRHEGYMQLKEAEYAHSLDLLWAFNLYHLFSSFRLFWVYYKPVMLLLKFLMILAYGTMLWYPTWQAGCFAFPILIVFVVSLIKWPFRVTSFNPQLYISLFCLLLLACLGVIQNAESSDSVFFQPSFLMSELLVINCIWLGFTVLWAIYVILRYTGLLCRSQPLWPQMDDKRQKKMAENTRKYLRALLCGRVVLEQALTTSKLFSPAHEVSRQIQIINAYCREAELLNDPIHDALWDLLDELLEAHATIAPFSLFAESVKPSIRVTAKELMKLLPSFKERLAQREYDFILISPMKKRMLLKMYAIGVFMNGRDFGKDKKTTFHSETIQRLYNPKTSIVLQQRHVEGDDGVYVDINLEDDEIPNNYKRQKQLREAGLILTGIQEDEEVEDDGDDEEDAGGSIRYTDSDMVSSINDQDMEDLRAMMAVVPSRPGTGVSSGKNSLAPTLNSSVSVSSRSPVDTKVGISATTGESTA